MGRKTTVQTDDPSTASRGAGVERAKVALGDALWDSIANTFWTPERYAIAERLQLAMLARVIGCQSIEQAAERLAVATLAEIKTWSATLATIDAEREPPAIDPVL